MGMWEFEAWDNDNAADWFGDLMDETGLRSKWLEALEGDIEEDYEVIRGAIWLFAQLGRVYVWPIDNYDDDLDKAISTGEKIASIDWLVKEMPEYINKLRAEIEVLKQRRDND